MKTQMDWQQVVLNGGPPCFRIEGEKFCGRAERWQGHPVDHRFISLESYVDSAVAEAVESTVERCAELFKSWMIPIVMDEDISSSLEDYQKSLHKAIRSLSPDPGFLDRVRLEARLEEAKEIFVPVNCAELRPHEVCSWLNNRIEVLERRLQESRGEALK